MKAISPHDSTTTTDENPSSSLYYTALVRFKANTTDAKARYSIVTMELEADEQKQFSTPGSNLRNELDEAIKREFKPLYSVEELRKTNSTVQALLPEEKEDKDFPYRPTRELKFAEKLTTDMVESTDLVASTPHRLFGFFNANFLPDSIYIWLFSGLVIGTGLINLARTIADYLGIRRAAKKAKEEAENAEAGMEIFSTISFGNPLPEKKLSRLAVAGLWADKAFKILFNFSLWYWVLWSIASAVFGIGVSVVPFGPVVATLVPFVLTLIQTFGDQTFQFIFNKEAVSTLSAKNKLSLGILDKLQLLDEEFGSRDNKSLPAHLEYISATVDGRKNAHPDKLIENPSKFVQLSRLATSTLVGFGSGFIMMTLVFFAGSSFLGTSLASLVTPFIITVLAGIVYAVKAFRESSERSATHAKAFKALEESYKVTQLVDKLNHFYQMILEKRQQAVKNGIKLMLAVADNPDFIFKNKIEAKTSLGRLWQGFKQIAHRFIIFIGGTESGSLLFRTIFGLVGGLATLGLSSNPLSFLSIGIIMLAVAIGWGITKLCHFYSEKTIAKEKVFLEQSEIYIRSLSREYEYLSTKLDALKPITATEEASEGEENRPLLSSSPRSSTTAHPEEERKEEESEGEEDKPLLSSSPRSSITQPHSLAETPAHPSSLSPSPLGQADNESEGEGEGGGHLHPHKH